MAKAKIMNKEGQKWVIDNDEIRILYGFDKLFRVCIKLLVGELLWRGDRAGSRHRFDTERCARSCGSNASSKARTECAHVGVVAP